mgnify:CR=1 FL=1|jgi:YHS domain-containing protein
MVTDPVCGMKANPQSAIIVRYKGQTYYSVRSCARPSSSASLKNM